MEFKGFGKPNVTPVVDWEKTLESYAMMEHYLCFPENWTLDGNGRVSSLASLMPGGSRYYQTDSAKRPLANASGGPGGVIGSMRFTQARADQLNRDNAFSAVTHTRAGVVANCVLSGDVGESCTFWGTTNGGTTKDFWYLRDNSSTDDIGELHGHITGNNTIAASQPMTHDDFTLITKTVKIDVGAGTTTVTLGRRAAGESVITFGSSITSGSTSLIAAAQWILGQNTDMNVVGLLAVQCDIVNDATARLAFENWAFGPDSPIGLAGA